MSPCARYDPQITVRIADALGADMVERFTEETWSSLRSAVETEIDRALEGKPAEEIRREIEQLCTELTETVEKLRNPHA